MKLKSIMLMERWKHGDFPNGTESHKYNNSKYILEYISVRGRDEMIGFDILENALKYIEKAKIKNDEIKVFIDIEELKNDAVEKEKEQ